ncbi:MAG: hypothetical protein BYD32DRAFT_419650 [Podila humilis]|nr:MAG: hypothetical protein BYD32DRAFT_419650 [Podila humilis]
MTTVVLSPHYGYTVATAVVSSLLTVFLGSKVTSFRKIAQVPLPFLYADQADAMQDHNKYLFNCYQRVHQNTLEGFAAYLVLLLLCGIWYPIPAAVLGDIWILGRIFYYRGYTTGDPHKRMHGAFGHLGEFGLMCLAGKIAYNLIMSTA